MDITFVSLEPTRIPMSLSIMTISGPMFIDPICVPWIPCICPIAFGDGLAICIGMLIFCSGDGEAAGIGVCV